MIDDLPSASTCTRPEDVPSDYGSGYLGSLEEFLRLARVLPNDRFGPVPIHFIKFFVAIEEGSEQDQAYLTYFVNTPCFRNHGRFIVSIGCTGDNRFGEQVAGSVYFVPTPDGSGDFFFDIENSDGTQSEVTVAYRQLRENIPFAREFSYVAIEDEQAALARTFESPEFPVLESVEEREFRLLNPGRSFGRLRRVSPGELPLASDIVIYDALPNDVPQVAGIITLVPQTPLAHANLRAVQSGIPNVYVEDIGSFEGLLGEFVYYEASEAGPLIRPASEQEVQGYLLAVRGTSVSEPDVQLRPRRIRSLSDLTFADRNAYGSKAAGVAELVHLGVPSVSHGYAVPFHFYDVFMRHNGLFRELDALLETEVTPDALERFRRRIRDGEMPRWMMDELAAVQAEFDGDIRCRSSASAEDTLQQSAAGLYESYTHHQPDEGHLSKSIRQVYASLFTYRAFAYRSFYGIDHRSVAMGVLLHPNFENEIVNGVALTYDMLYGYENRVFYVNALRGEDLVTNPSPGASLLEFAIEGEQGSSEYLVAGGEFSAGEDDGGVPLSLSQAYTLRDWMIVIDDHFRQLHGSPDPFAIEVEFKVTSSGQLAIKQARPWVFATPGLPQWTTELCSCRCGTSQFNHP